MSATLTTDLETSQPCGTDYDTDTPKVPWQVIGRIAAECSREDRRFEPFLWGREMYGQSLAIGNDVWTVGSRKNRHTGAITIMVTVDGHKYGGGEKYQRTWDLHLDDILNSPVELPVR